HPAPHRLPSTTLFRPEWGPAAAGGTPAARWLDTQPPLRHAVATTIARSALRIDSLAGGQAGSPHGRHGAGEHGQRCRTDDRTDQDRKSTRLNSSHGSI